jgi:hypothetical protein
MSSTWFSTSRPLSKVRKGSTWWSNCYPALDPAVSRSALAIEVSSFCSHRCTSVCVHWLFDLIYSMHYFVDLRCDGIGMLAVLSVLWSNVPYKWTQENSSFVFTSSHRGKVTSFPSFWGIVNAEPAEQRCVTTASKVWTIHYALGQLRLARV